MKRIIFPLLVLIAALSTPYLIGSNIQPKLQTLLSSLEEIPGYEVRLESYESGYLHSTAFVSLAMDTDMFFAGLTQGGQAPPEELQKIIDIYGDGLLLKVDIAHGPLASIGDQQFFGMFAADIALAETPEAIKKFKADNGLTEDLVTLRLSMKFGGHGEVIINSPAFEINLAEGNISYGGFDSVTTLQKWGAVYSTEGEFHETVINSPASGSVVRILPITILEAVDMSAGYMQSTGNVEVHLTGIEVTGPINLSMGDLSIKAKVSSPTTETVTVDYQMSMANLTSNILPFPISNSMLDFSLKNLQREALQNFTSLISDPVTLQNPIDMQQKMLKQLSNMFSGDAEYRINKLSFEYGSDIAFSMGTGFSLKDGASAILANPIAMQNPLALIDYLNTDLDIEFTEGFLNLSVDAYLQSQTGALLAAGVPVENIPTIIEQQKAQYLASLPQLVQAGILISDAGKYNISASLKDRNLTVNGKPFPLPF